MTWIVTLKGGTGSVFFAADLQDYVRTVRTIKLGTLTHAGRDEAYFHGVIATYVRSASQETGPQRS